MLRYFLSFPALFVFRHILRIFRNPHKTSLRIILLHEVPRSSLPAFERLVRYISQRHQLVSPQEAAKWLDGTSCLAQSSERQPVLITFDDGFASNFSHAQMVLDRYQAKAVFFVCPGLMNLEKDPRTIAVRMNIKRGQADDGNTPACEDLMDWEQVRELQRAGHVIGNHGMTHHRLSELPLEKLEYEIMSGVDLMANELGARPDWYAFAFGDIDSITPEALRIISRHHRYCRSGIRGPNIFGAANPGTADNVILADHIDLNSPLSYQQLIVEGGLDFLYRRRWKQLTAMLKLGR